MYFDESAWVALGFILFIALVWKKASSAIGGMLDARSEKIKTELEEARQLHEEAKAELVKFKKLKAEAEQEAETILANATAAAERIRETAATKAADNIARREAQAKAQIAAAENAVVTELRQKAATLAIQAAQQVITSKLDEKASLELVEASAKQVEAAE